LGQSNFRDGNLIELIQSSGENQKSGFQALLSFHDDIPTNFDEFFEE